MRAGEVLGDRYKLIDPLGNGGMAVVWKAHDEVLGRTVAVKLLADRHAGDPRSRQQIRAEARAAAALSHPNIAQVYDYGEFTENGACLPFVVMELVRGSTLQQRLAEGPLPPRYAMRIGAEVAAALAAAHADGLVHRDIKPPNIMVTATGVKVVDFGIAAAVRPSGSPETAFELLGTPAYLAPERLTDDAVEPASDVYSLGVLLYRMLTGESPWDVDTTTQVLAAHIYVPPTPLPQLPDVPTYISALCNRCLSKDPTERPSAREAATLLAQAAGLRVVDDVPAPVVASGSAAPVPDEPSVVIRADTSAPPVPPLVTPPARPAAGGGPGPDRHRNTRVMVLGGAVLAVAALLLWIFLPGDRREPGAAVLAPGPSASAAAAAATPAGRVTRGAPVPPQPGVATVPGRTPSPGAPAGGPAASPVGGPAGGPAGGGVPGATRPADPGQFRTTAPAPATTAAEPPPAGPTGERTLSSSGGTVRATCPSSGTAQLLSWSASKPWKVEDVSAGPGPAPTAAFRHGNEHVVMTVTCSGGVPSTSNDDS